MMVVNVRAFNVRGLLEVLAVDTFITCNTLA
jgi:hypothetical protein